MSLKTAFIAILIISLAISETEGRRKILRGRRTINRWYMRPLMLPAWVIIILIAIAELIIAAIVYLITRVTILDKTIPSRYSNVEPLTTSVP